MITQSQYFDIEDYLQQQCRVIEPELLEELIDHFMDGIEAAGNSDEDFVAAFEAVKQDFGGKSGVQRIQQKWQVNALELHAKGLLAEFLSYFRGPFLWFITTYSILVIAFVFYFNFRLVGWERPHIWYGMISGALLGGLGTTAVFYFQNKADFGTYGLQARNWLTFLATLSVTFSLCIMHVLGGFVTSPLYAQLVCAGCTIVGSLIFLTIFRYSNRELYPEHAWY